MYRVSRMRALDGVARCRRCGLCRLWTSGYQRPAGLSSSWTAAAEGQGVTGADCDEPGPAAHGEGDDGGREDPKAALLLKLSLELERKH